MNPWMIGQTHVVGRKVPVWFGVLEHPLVMGFVLGPGADDLTDVDPLALAEFLSS